MPIAMPALEACSRCQAGSIATCAQCRRRYFPSDGGRLPWRCASCRQSPRGTRLQINRERILERESICPFCGMTLPDQPLAT